MPERPQCRGRMREVMGKLPAGKAEPRDRAGAPGTAHPTDGMGQHTRAMLLSTSCSRKSCPLPGFQALPATGGPELSPPRYPVSQRPGSPREGWTRFPGAASQPLCLHQPRASHFPPAAGRKPSPPSAPRVPPVPPRQSHLEPLRAQRCPGTGSQKGIWGWTRLRRPNSARWHDGDATLEQLHQHVRARGQRGCKCPQGM